MSAKAHLLLAPNVLLVSNKMSVSCGNTRKASILLVRKLYTLMQNLGPLPDSVSLNMKLAYYEEGEGPTRHHAGVVRALLRGWGVSTVTPQDYQPLGFKEAESETFVFEKEPVKLSMGEVVTPYHSLKLGMATERHRLEQVNHRALHHAPPLFHRRREETKEEVEILLLVFG